MNRDRTTHDAAARPAPRLPGGALLAALLFLTAAAGGLSAQETGRIAGRVVAAQTGEPVPAATVAVQGTSLRAVADVGGRYAIDGVPAGARTITASALGYAPKTVTGVSVAPGAATELDVSLAPEALVLEGLTVTASAERGSTAALLSERRAAATVVDAIGADQISRTPDGDAAAALRRVPGISVVEGKYVYVRGLGERYGATTLNGSNLPSPVPDRKAVPLDVIPSALLESVTTSKTYSPDQPGDHAGGLVQIETRTAPASRVLRLSGGLGYTAGATLDGGPANPGGDWGFLGFDGGAYGLPSSISRTSPASLPADPAARRAFLEELTAPPFGAVDDDAPLNGSFGLAYGDEFDVLGRPLGVVGTVSWSSGVSRPEERADRFYAIGGGAPREQVDYDTDVTEREITVGALVDVSMRINDTDRVTAGVVYNHLTENEARLLDGHNATVERRLRQTRLQYVENTLTSAQLRGEHLLRGLGDLSARWRLAFSRAERDEPGTRTTIYGSADPAQPFSYFDATTQSGLTLHQELTDDGWNPGLDLKLPFGLRGLDASVAVGASADLRERDVYTRRIRLQARGLPGDVRTLPPDRLFVPERIGDGAGGFELIEGTFLGDNYAARQDVYAAYGMLDLPITERLRASGGVRVERAAIDLDVVDLFGTGTGALPTASLEDTDLLPALNLSYELNDGMTLRAGVSRTVARPQFRELAPYLYTDYFGGATLVGNPFVERTSILNGDLRWEWYLGRSSLLSASAFAKRFDDPIEPVTLVLGTNQALTYANSDRATLYGAELEARTNLGRLARALEPFTLNGNLTLVRSDVRADSVTLLDLNPSGMATPVTVAATSTGRPLFGQSPYVVNVGLTYDRAGSGTRATLLYNRFGRRLDAFGGDRLPDVYEEARNQLDLTVEQALPRGLALKLSATRLLGERVEFTQEFPSGDEVVTREYELGRTFSVGLSWEP